MRWNPPTNESPYVSIRQGEAAILKIISMTTSLPLPPTFVVLDRQTGAVEKFMPLPILYDDTSSDHERHAEHCDFHNCSKCSGAVA